MASRLRARLLLGATVTAGLLVAASGCGSRSGLLSGALSGPAGDDVEEGGAVLTTGGVPTANGGSGSTTGGGVALGGKATGGVPTSFAGSSVEGGYAPGGAGGQNPGTAGEPAGGEGGAPACDLDCSTTPVPSCVSDKTLRRFRAPGTCAANACSYDYVDSDCLTGCQDGKCNTFPVLLSAGEQSTCAAVNNGPLMCWGANEGGELGVEWTLKPKVPVEVTAVGTSARAVAVGNGDACAVTAAGSVNGMLDAPPGPVDVVGLASGVSQVASGELMSCVVMTTGGVKCWGWGVLVPTDVPGLASGVTAVAVNSNACALTSAGGVKCWGENNFGGVLGNGTTDPNKVPGDVVGLTYGAVAIAVGQYHACAVLETGAVKCWGSGGDSRLGNGTTTTSFVPVNVSGF